MKKNEICAVVTEIFHKVSGDTTIVFRPEIAAKDIPGWDSMKMISLILAVEQRFGIRLRSREIDQLKCLGDFVDLVGAKL